MDEKDIRLWKDYALGLTYIGNNPIFAFKDFMDFEVIINKPAVILIVHHFDPYKSDEKYVAKAYNEKFDPEKGLAICLLKYYGVSYPDLKRMIKSAKVQEIKKKFKKNKKKAGK